MATRYKVTKEQVEKLVENFVMEAAAPEAKKHIQGSVGGDKQVEKRSNSGSASAKDWGRNDEKKHAPEAKKHVKGDGSGAKQQMEERPNTPNAEEEDWGVSDEVSHAPEAKKHVKK